MIFLTYFRYFVHHPSKFLAARANTTALTYDAFLM